MKKILIFFLLAFSCNHNVISAKENDISFTIMRIKQDYPGYKDKVIGNAFDIYSRKMIRQYPNDTFRILSSLINYFKDQHLVIYEANALKSINCDTAVCQRNLQMLKTYFLRNMPKKYEGYWINDRSDYVIAIKRVGGNANQMVAYTIETRNDALPAGIVCQKFNSFGNHHYLTEYLSVRGNRLYMESEFRNDSVFTTGSYGKWKKLKNYKYPALPDTANFSYRASGRLLDSNTFLITIPGNSNENTVLVNDIIRKNKKIISTTPNLVIDLRNNMGGTISTYDSLFPFVYTKPIHQVSGYGYRSKVYIESLKEKVKEYLQNDSNNTAIIRELQDEIKRQETGKGKLLNEGYVFKFDSIMSMPKNVALILNYACQSAAEMMILDFKQSSKVTTFGEHTMGAVDYLSNFTINLPSKRYRLILPASKRIIPEGQSKIDGIGIYPDVPISDTVSDWVKFVQNYYQGK